jgi:hypothetical protein
MTRSGVESKLEEAGGGPIRVTVTRATEVTTGHWMFSEGNALKAATARIGLSSI